MPIKIPEINSRSDLARLRLQLEQDSSVNPAEKARILSEAEKVFTQRVSLSGLIPPAGLRVPPLPHFEDTSQPIGGNKGLPRDYKIPEVEKLGEEQKPPEPPEMLRPPKFDPSLRKTGVKEPGFSPGGPPVPTPVLDAAQAPKPPGRKKTVLGLPQADVDPEAYTVKPFAETLFEGAADYLGKAAPEGLSTFGKFEPGVRPDTLKEFGELAMPNLGAALRNAVRMGLNIPSDLASFTLSMSALSQMSLTDVGRLADAIVRGGTEALAHEALGGPDTSRSRIFKVIAGAILDSYLNPKVLTEHPVGPLLDALTLGFVGVRHGAKAAQIVRNSLNVARKGKDGFGKAMGIALDQLKVSSAEGAIPNTSYIRDQTARVNNFQYAQNQRVDDIRLQQQRVQDAFRQTGLPIKEADIVPLPGQSPNIYLVEKTPFSLVPDLSNPHGQMKWVNGRAEPIGPPTRPDSPYFLEGWDEAAIGYVMDRYNNPTTDQMVHGIQEFFQRIGEKPHPDLLKFAREAKYQDTFEGVANGLTVGVTGPEEVMSFIGRQMSGGDSPMLRRSLAQDHPRDMISQWYPDMSRYFLDTFGEPNIPEFSGVFSILSPQYAVEPNTTAVFQVAAHMRLLESHVGVQAFDEPLVAGWLSILNHKEFEFFPAVDSNTTRNYYELVRKAGQQGLMMPPFLRELGEEILGSKHSLETSRFQAIINGGAPTATRFDLEFDRTLNLPGSQKKFKEAGDDPKKIATVERKLANQAAKRVLGDERKTGPYKKLENPMQSLMRVAVQKMVRSGSRTRYVRESIQKVKMTDHQIGKLARLYVKGEFGGLEAATTGARLKTAGFNTAVWEHAAGQARGWEGSLLNLMVADTNVAKGANIPQYTKGFNEHAYRGITTYVAYASRDLGMTVGPGQASLWNWGKSLDPGTEKRLRDMFGSGWPHAFGSANSAKAASVHAREFLESIGVNKTKALTDGLTNGHITYGYVPQSITVTQQNARNLAAEGKSIVGSTRSGAFSAGTTIPARTNIEDLVLPQPLPVAPYSHPGSHTEFHNEYFDKILVDGKHPGLRSLEKRWGFTHHFVRNTRGTFKGMVEPGYSLMVYGEDDVVQMVNALFQDSFQQEANVIVSPRKYLEQESVYLQNSFPDSPFNVSPAGFVSKQNRDVFTIPEIEALAGQMPPGYDFTVDPGNGGLRFLYLGFLPEMDGIDDVAFFHTLRSTLDNSGIADGKLDLQHFFARSRYVESKEAKNIIGGFGEWETSRGISGLPGDAGGAPGLSPRWFYDTFYRSYREQIADYVTQGKFGQDVLTWYDQPQFMRTNGEELPQHLIDAFGPPPPQALIPGTNIPLSLTPQGQPIPPVGGGSGISEKALRPETTILYHGTPFKFDPEPGAPLGRFRDDKLLTGEGHMTYSAGHYLNDAGATEVAKEYQKNVTRKRFGTDPLLHLNGKPLKPLSRGRRVGEMERLLELSGLIDKPIAGFLGGRIEAQLAQLALPRSELPRGFSEAFGKHHAEFKMRPEVVDFQRRTDALAHSFDVLEDALVKAEGAPITIDDVDRILQRNFEMQKELLSIESLSPRPPSVFVGGSLQEVQTNNTAIREILEPLLRTAKIEKKPAKGHIVEAALHATAPDFILWDKPFTEQSQKVQDATMRMFPKPAESPGNFAEAAEGLWKWKPNPKAQPTEGVNWRPEALEVGYYEDNYKTPNMVIESWLKKVWEHTKRLDIGTMQRKVEGRRLVQEAADTISPITKNGQENIQMANDALRALDNGDLSFVSSSSPGGLPSGEWIIPESATGKNIWFAVNELYNRELPPLRARDALLAEGVRGMKFLDQASRIPRRRFKWADEAKAKGLDEAKKWADDVFDNFDGDIEKTVAQLRLGSREGKKAADLIESGDLIPEIPKLTHNFVVYNPADLEILRILGLSAILLGGGSYLYGEAGLPRDQDAVNPLPQ